MLEIILDNHILMILMGVSAVLGVVSKCIAGITLKRLVKAAGNMSKSNHKFIRLVRAKFEHACMVSDKVQNVEVFVEKYMYEYKVLGMRLYGWRRLEKAAIGFCLGLGGVAAIGQYAAYGMGEEVLQNGALGAGLAILLFLFHITTDERYQLEAVKNYIVDYLENVCAHRYEKAYQKEIQVMAPPEIAAQESVTAEEPMVDIQVVEAAVQEAKKAESKKQVMKAAEVQAAEIRAAESEEPEIKEPSVKEPEIKEKVNEVPVPEKTPRNPRTPAPTIPEPIKVPEPQIVMATAKEERRSISKEVLIREILEEFLA